MSMNGNARRTIDTLVALDFRLDDDASSPGVRVYWHPNDPARRVKVFSGISDIAAKKVRNLASEIAGLSSAGERIPASIGETALIKKENERAKKIIETARANRAREEYQRKADAAKTARAAAQAEAERIARHRRIAALMQPGNGR